MKKKNNFNYKLLTVFDEIKAVPMDIGVITISKGVNHNRNNGVVCFGCDYDNTEELYKYSLFQGEGLFETCFGVYCKDCMEKLFKINLKESEEVKE